MIYELNTETTIEYDDIDINYNNHLVILIHKGSHGGRNALNIPRELIEQLKAQGATIAQVAQCLGCSKETIYNRLKE